MLRTTKEIAQHAAGLCAVLREKCEDTCSEAATMIEVLSKRLENSQAEYAILAAACSDLKEENEIIHPDLADEVKRILNHV